MAVDLIELECPAVGCNHGVAGAKYRTPKLEYEKAFDILKMHVASHDQRHGVSSDARNLVMGPSLSQRKLAVHHYRKVYLRIGSLPSRGNGLDIRRAQACRTSL